MAIHEAAHGILSLIRNFRIKKLTIVPDSEKGFAGYMELDHQEIEAKLKAIKSNGDAIRQFLMDLACVVVAGEIADLKINGLAPDIAAARSAGDIAAMEPYFDLFQVGIDGQEVLLDAARGYVSAILDGAKAKQGIAMIADWIEEIETLTAEDLEGKFKFTVG